MRLEYSPEAVQDLIRLRAFIEEKNPYAAEKIAKQLLEGICKLKVFPKIGLGVSRAPDPEVIRDLFVSDYTVRYLLLDDTVFILRVWHGKENDRHV